MQLKLNTILSHQDKEKIHRSAVYMLENLGYLCNHPVILDAMRQAGCDIGEELTKPHHARPIRFTEKIITDALAKAPKQFTLHPIAPEYKSINFGTGETHFGTNASDMIWDLDTNELRGTTMSDFVLGSRLIDACENFDAIFGFPCYWMYDIASKEDYDKYRYMGVLMAGTAMLHCGKCVNRVFFASTETELSDLVALWRIAAGGAEEYRKKPCGCINVCQTSPYSLLSTYTGPGEPLDWADWVVVATEVGIPIRIESSSLLGLSAPVTPAGAIVQDIAEFLALNAILQTLNPGHPVVLSDYTATGDIFTGTKAAPRPEAMLQRMGIKAMADYYNMPSGYYMQSDAVHDDSQAAWEHFEIYLLSALTGVDLVMSAGGLCSADIMSFRQLVIDNEMIGWVKHLVKGFEISDDAIPLDLMVETGFGAVGNHFIGAKHTRQNYKSAMFKRSAVTNAYLRDAWLERGGKSISERARERAWELLKKHEPNIPENLQTQVRDYMTQALKRENVKEDEIKRIMDKTYWKG